MSMGRCSLDHLRYRVASAAASFQPEFACFRRVSVRSDQTFSLSRIPPDVKDETLQDVSEVLSEVVHWLLQHGLNLAEFSESAR